ncbi:MAG: Flagellar basal body rod protein FlgB [Alphaproteobacteria bacterium MarineAlpha9_Bin4]|nr:flagellar basal body rod protein FlgB [Pelagibacterales bacterium]PPR25818.1 MAG: Flagellar basal body rod protein FlgB [Alphaproteobacteria bacterium MarineAlpha9_Bin4]|tara:strand:- start:2411 stop:2797 length:387 start_codon:yes stop_codon:yes gene_type:complete
MQGIKQNLKMLGAALSLRAKRNEILASNIANSATPHYKARDIDFETEIKKYQSSGPIKVTNDKHIPVMRPASPGAVQYRKNINPSLDGNTVELAVEQLEFAQNSMKYQSTLSFLNGKINTLMSAIKGE